MSSALPIETNKYVLAAPDSRTIVLSAETFEAIYDIIRLRRSGFVNLQFNEGRLSGVESVIRKVYK